MKAQTYSPNTVDQAVFRSRWVGTPADQFVLPPEIHMLEEQEMSLGDFLRSIRDKAMQQPTGSAGLGLRIGPTVVHPSVTLGWEYSNENNSNAAATNSSNDSSFFIAPALSVDYFREVGAWTVDAHYSGSYTFYTNRNYQSSGENVQNNPFQQTFGLQVGVEGSRYRIQLGSGFAYGSGLNVESGENNTELTWNATLSSDYQLAQYTHVGTLLNATQDVISNTQNSPTGSVGSYDGTLYMDYDWTGKTRFRFEAGAGVETQAIDGNAGLGYGQVLVSIIYEPTPKLNFSAGIGARYLANMGDGGGTEETGFRPAFRAKAAYRLTEKTSISAYVAMEGADIRPSFNLECAWQPRLNTSLALNFYQNQEYSSIQSSQYRISRGVMGSISETFFSRAQVTLAAGYEQWQYVSLGNSDEHLISNTNQSQNYFFVSGMLAYRIQDWLILNGLIWLGSDRQGSSSSPQVRASIGITLIY